MYQITDMLKCKFSLPTTRGGAAYLFCSADQCMLQTFLNSKESKIRYELLVIRTGPACLGKHCKSLETNYVLFIYLFEIIWNILHAYISTL